MANSANRTVTVCVKLTETKNCCSMFANVTENKLEVDSTAVLAIIIMMIPISNLVSENKQSIKKNL
jgi:hypothetical protein